MSALPPDAPMNFQATRWTLIHRLSSPVASEANRAMDEVCRIYWPPLYALARRRALEPADAEDATQDFFCHCLGQKLFTEADRSKGRLRALLKAAFCNFLTSQYRRDHALRRGGRAVHVPIDGESAEALYLEEMQTNDTPERAYDRTWALTLLAEALNDLRRSYAAQGKTEHFEAALPFLPGGRASTDAGTYRSAGLARGLTVSNMRLIAFRLRRDFRDAVVSQIAGTLGTTDPAAINAEIEHLMQVLAGGDR